MSDKTYRTVHGIVAFEPEEREAGDTPVRNITVQQAGFGPYAVRVGATLWPSHDHVDVQQGDVVTLEGSYTSREQGDRTFHNISVTKILVHGEADRGQREGTVNTREAASDDDIPF